MIENHNSGQWLRVEYHDDLHRGRRTHYRESGWYVIRRCPCCDGLPVTLALDSEADAERARRAMIECSMVLGT